MGVAHDDQRLEAVGRFEDKKGGKEQFHQEDKPLTVW